MQLQKKKDQVKQESSSFRTNLDLYQHFMQITDPHFLFRPAVGVRHKRDKKGNIQKTSQTTRILDTDDIFPATQITGVKLFRKNGSTQEIDVRSKKPFSVPTDVTKVIAYAHHVEIEHKVAQGKEQFHASGFKYNFLEKDQLADAIAERTVAAYCLAYSAKAKGWTDVDLGETKCPIERYLLKLACNDVGLECNDNVESSIDPDVTVEPYPIKGALFDAAIPPQLTDIIAQQAPNSWLELDENIAKGIKEKMRSAIQSNADAFLQTKTVPYGDILASQTSETPNTSIDQNKPIVPEPSNDTPPPKPISHKTAQNAVSAFGY